MMLFNDKRLLSRTPSKIFYKKLRQRMDLTVCVCYFL